MYARYSQAGQQAGQGCARCERSRVRCRPECNGKVEGLSQAVDNVSVTDLEETRSN